MAKGPQAIGDVLAQLMARRGFAGVQSSAAAETAWREAAGDLARFTRLGAVRRGKLEVTVANSTVVQELSYRKPALVGVLAKLLPEQRISDLRFRVGNVE